MFQALKINQVFMVCKKLIFFLCCDNILNIFTSIQIGAEQIKNIHSYAIYLEEKVAVYRELKVDFAKVPIGEGGGRLRKLTVAKGLLREVNILQRQLDTLLNCKVCCVSILYIFMYIYEV